MIKGLLMLVSLLFCTNANAQNFQTSDAIKLGGAINSSETEESMPVFASDSMTLYFVRSFGKNRGGKNDQDIYFSEKYADLVYSKGLNLTELNNKSNNAVFGINVNNNRLYLLNSYRGKKNEKKGISYSDMGFEFWDKPISFKIPNLEMKGEHVGFHMTIDEKALIISYDGPKSLGKEDLYVSLNTPNGWTVPKHLGNVINSVGTEMSPFLSKSWDTLYFSSNGFGGEGDVDIFYSVRQGEWNDWSTPINLGPKINSPKFDAYFIVTPNHFYWSSNRDSELSDIWMAFIKEKPRADLSISYQVTDATIYRGSDGKIDITIKGGVPPYATSWSTGSRKENLNNVEKGIYLISVSDSKGMTISEKIKVNQVPPGIKMDLSKLARLNPIYFDLNSSKLREDAKYELDKLVDVLIEYPKMKVEIGSHTDCRPSAESNLTLSQERANSTLEYLQKLIPNPERISAKGYGSSKPIADCDCNSSSGNECSEDEHKLNRRSEFLVLE